MKFFVSVLLPSPVDLWLIGERMVEFSLLLMIFSLIWSISP